VSPIDGVNRAHCNLLAHRVVGGAAGSRGRSPGDFATLGLRSLPAREARLRKHNFAISPRVSREVCQQRSPFSNRGRGECRAPGAPAASCAHGVVSMHTSIHSEFAEITRHPHAMVLRLIAYSPRRPGFLASVAREQDARELDASVGASGPHAFAVRLRRIRQSAIRVHRIPPPTFVTIAKRPSSEAGRGGYESDLGQAKTDIFCGEDWTGRISLNCFRKSRCTRRGMERSSPAGPSIDKCAVTIIPSWLRRTCPCHQRVRAPPATHLLRLTPDFS
jgi:hypothetical protein